MGWTRVAPASGFGIPVRVGVLLAPLLVGGRAAPRRRRFCWSQTGAAAARPARRLPLVRREGGPRLRLELPCLCAAFGQPNRARAEMSSSWEMGESCRYPTSLRSLLGASTACRAHWPSGGSAVRVPVAGVASPNISPSSSPPPKASDVLRAALSHHLGTLLAFRPSRRPSLARRACLLISLVSYRPLAHSRRVV